MKDNHSHCLRGKWIDCKPALPKNVISRNDNTNANKHGKFLNNFKNNINSNFLNFQNEIQAQMTVMIILLSRRKRLNLIIKIITKAIIIIHFLKILNIILLIKMFEINIIIIIIFQVEMI